MDELAINLRVYLNVPYDEKEEAKSLGCLWDPERRSWYVRDSDHGKSQVSRCLTKYCKTAPYKLIDGRKVLIKNVPPECRGFTTNLRRNPHCYVQNPDGMYDPDSDESG